MPWAQARLSDMHCDVLVVEDDPDLREALAELLRDEGFAVSTAENGARALKQLEGAELPKVIVSDLMMPEMNGWELLDHVRGSDRLRGVPVVVMTAAAEPKIPHDIPVMRKPIDIDDMTRRISSFCHS
jgi:CheY-like chemotaxis protein